MKIAGLLIAAAVLTGCSILLGEGVGISRHDAIAAAGHEAPGQVTGLISAESGPLGRFVGAGTLPEEPRDHLVWAVKFRGDFGPHSCGPAPPPGQQAHCPPTQHTALVVLDFTTGDFILAAVPADGT